MKAVSLLSGGMDSTTLAYWLKDKGYDLHLVSVNYGQRHEKELVAAEGIANDLGADHQLVKVEIWLPGSALTDGEVEVPEGHYAAESMKATVVPNRNAFMLALAFGIAIAQGADAVGCGVHAGDHAIYPDCRPAFLDAFQAMQMLATEGFGDPILLAPFVHKSKADIVSIGDKLGVDWVGTWSCYKGGTVHCGKCGTCTERREAFSLAGVVDPTTYAGLS